MYGPWQEHENKNEKKKTKKNNVSETLRASDKISLLGTYVPWPINILSWPEMKL